MVEKLEDYKWCSHNGYLSISNKWNWLNKDFIYSLLSENKHEWIRRYRQFISADDDKEITEAVERDKWPVALGPKSFIDWVKGAFYELKSDDEVPQSSRLRPSPDLIIQAVCDFYDVEQESIKDHKTRSVQ